MATEPMSLIERLRNPQYVTVPGADAALDVAQTRKDMNEAADALQASAHSTAKRITDEAFTKFPRAGCRADDTEGARGADTDGGRTVGSIPATTAKGA